MLPKYRFPKDTKPKEWKPEQVAHTVDLLNNQDSVTWTIVSVSFATQGILIGFYFQLARGSTARVALDLVGLLVALSFAVFVARSNRYMAYYARLLAQTESPEFNPPRLWYRVLMWSEENAPSLLSRIERLIEWGQNRKWAISAYNTISKAASATALLHVVDGGWITLWVLILLYGNLF